MLIITRKENQAIIIRTTHYPDIKVVINRIDGFRIQLGFEAPLDVQILREEIAYDKENRDD